MFSSIMTGGLNGMEAYLLRAEVDISHGLPTFCMVGSLSNEVRDITMVRLIQSSFKESA